MGLPYWLGPFGKEDASPAAPGDYGHGGLGPAGQSSSAAKASWCQPPHRLFALTGDLFPALAGIGERLEVESRAYLQPDLLGAGPARFRRPGAGGTRNPTGDDGNGSACHDHS